MINDESNLTSGSPRSQTSVHEMLFGRAVIDWIEEGRITLGRFRAKLEELPPAVHGPLLGCFSMLTELAGAETRTATAELYRRVRHGVPEPRAADWHPVLDALAREHAADGVTEDTTLNELSEVLWREHVRQD